MNIAKFADKCAYLATDHKDTWRNEPELRWLAGLVAEVGELADALCDRHEHSPEHELTQIAAICLNWLDMRNSRET